MSGAHTETKPDPSTFWIQTHSGKKFYFLAPSWDTEGIEVYDIATALSRAPRYCGHTKDFYSVAQHCVHVTEYVRQCGGSVRDQLIALLHDATEAYLADIPSPAKKMLPEYSELEHSIWERVSQCFLGEVVQIPPLIKEGDLALLVAEAEDCFDFPPLDNWIVNYGPRAEMPIHCWKSDIARKAFLDEYYALATEYEHQTASEKVAS